MGKPECVTSHFRCDLCKFSDTCLACRFQDECENTDDCSGCRHSSGCGALYYQNADWDQACRVRLPRKIRGLLESAMDTLKGVCGRLYSRLYLETYSARQEIEAARNMLARVLKGPEPGKTEKTMEREDRRPDCAQKGDRFCENCRYSATCSAVVKPGYCWAHLDCTTCEHTKDCAAFHHRGENWEDFGRIKAPEEAGNELESDITVLKAISGSLLSARNLLDEKERPTRSGNYVAKLHVNDALVKTDRLMRDIESRRNVPAGKKLDLSCHRFILALMSILDDAYGFLKGNVFSRAKKARARVREAMEHIRHLDAYSISGDKNDIIFLAPEGIGKKKLEEILSGTEEKSLEERVRDLERELAEIRRRT